MDEELQFDDPAEDVKSNKALISKEDIDVSLAVGLDADGELICKFNLFVMPSMPRSWCVLDTKRWNMMATCCGDLESCAVACLQSLLDFDKARPFVYVTTNGEPPETDSPPFAGMLCVGFVADCEPDGLCDLCKLPGVRALEIRKQRSTPKGYRVRIFHDGSSPLDPAEYIDPSLLYDMAQVPQSGRARANSKMTKKKKPRVLPLTQEEREAAAKTAAEAAAKSEQYIQDSTAKVAETLGESNTEVLERAVRFAGMSVIKPVLDSTMQMEESGGMMVADGSRRRQPGGVFLQLLGAQLSPEQYTLIFQRMKSPSLVSQTPSFGQTPPETSLGGSPAGIAISASSGSMLNSGEDVQYGSSLGSSPHQSLLGASLGSSLGSSSLSIKAREFVPQAKSVS